MPVLLYVLILWAIVAVACLVAWGVGKKRGKTEPGEYSDALMYIGFSFGILFGLLVTFGTNHYSSALNEAESEATTLLAMYDDMAPLPPRERAAARHGLICYMRSVVEHDWEAQEDGAAQQAPEPRVRFDNLRRLIRTLPEQTSAGGQSAGPRIIQEIADAGSARQQLLFLARPQIPTILWVLVFISAGVVMLLIVSEFRSRPRTTRIVVHAAVFVVLTFQVGALVSLDHPFAAGARIQPDAIQRGLDLLEAGRAGDPVFRDCAPIDVR